MDAHFYVAKLIESRTEKPLEIVELGELDKLHEFICLIRTDPCRAFVKTRYNISLYVKTVSGPENFIGRYYLTGKISIGRVKALLGESS